MAESASDLTEEQQRVKERFIDDRGFWSELYDDWLRLDPAFLDRYRELSGNPWKDGGVLDPKVKEFVYIAIDCNTTHLYNEGTRVHINNAFDEGATVDEIMEVFQLASVLGVHSVTEGVPILVDEAGPIEPDPEEAERREDLRREFEERRGYWSELWEDVLNLDPDYFEAYMNYSAHPWDEGPLDPKVKEFVYIAIDIATTHLYNKGARVHMQNALSYGATPEEVMEVFELASVLGVHTMTDSVPILVEEAKKRGKLPEDF
jgi:alkylhydroperoxidase/carboxymuconolactone decarboxylase family protein YurZ